MSKQTESDMPPPEYTLSSKQSEAYLKSKKNKQCGMVLKKGVTIWNVLTIYLLKYIQALGFIMAGNFFTILLQDTKYYHISEKKLGTVSGSFNTYISVAVLPFQLLFGIVLDKCGRKIPLVLSCFIAAPLIAILPYGGGLYPWLFIVQFVLNLVLQVVAVSPLLADYVHEATTGAAGSYIQIAYAVQSAIYSFGFLQLAESIDLAYISWMAGGIALLIAIYCSVFIINVYNKDHRPSHLSSARSGSQEQAQLSCWQTVIENLFYTCKAARKRKMLIPVLLVGITQQVMDLSYESTVSIWVSKYIYNGDIAKISYHNKLLLGISHAVSVPCALVFGILYDKCGELVVAPLVYILAGSPYIAIYFMGNLDSPLAYSLEIFSAVFAQITGILAVILLARHSPPRGTGKVFAFKSFLDSLFSMGYSYLHGWILDQRFNRVAFLLIVGFAFSMTAMFIGIRLCCKRITDIPEEEEQVFMLAVDQN